MFNSLPCFAVFSLASMAFFSFPSQKNHDFSAIPMVMVPITAILQYFVCQSVCCVSSCLRGRSHQRLTQFECGKLLIHLSAQTFIINYTESNLNREVGESKSESDSADLDSEFSNTESDFETLLLVLMLSG